MLLQYPSFSTLLCSRLFLTHTHSPSLLCPVLTAVQIKRSHREGDRRFVGQCLAIFTIGDNEVIRAFGDVSYFHCHKGAAVLHSHPVAQVMELHQKIPEKIREQIREQRGQQRVNQRTDVRTFLSVMDWTPGGS